MIDLLLQQALAQATILWNELGQEGSKCEESAGEAVDLILGAMVEEDSVNKCLRAGKPPRA